MAQVKQESSVLFSLNQLMTLEKQRLLEEQEAARRAASAEQAARFAEERRASEERAAARRAEEERRRREDAFRREEEARLEAMRLAAIEKARVEVEQRARIEAMERQQQHERELARLAQDKHRRRLSRLVMASSVAGVVVLGATFGIYFGKIKPDAERAHAEQSAARAAQEQRLAELKTELEARTRQIANLEVALKEARTDIEEADLLRRLASAKSARAQVERTVTGRVAAPSPPEKCVCQEGDPMCGCLP